MSVAAGGGVTEFTQTGTRSVTQVGGSWDVRMAFWTRRLLGVEISYVGGANVIYGLGLVGSTKLIRNGIEGALRLNAPVSRRDTLFEPYVAAGAGWNGYRITNVMTTTASVRPTSANTFTVPLAIGFALCHKGVVVDGRYTVRPTYRQTTLRDEGSDGLTNWDVGAIVGYEF